MGDQEVGRGPDVVGPQCGVPAQAGLVVHQDRVGDLVQLESASVGCGLAVEQRVARHGPVRQLLAVEQEPDRVPRRGQVAVGQQAGERLVQVAGEHLAVGTEVGRLATGVGPGRHRLAPRAGQRGHDRAGEGLVLARLEHVRGQVVVLDQPGRRTGRLPRVVGRRPVQARVVRRPSRPGTSVPSARRGWRASPGPCSPRLPACGRSRARASACRPGRAPVPGSPRCGRPARTSTGSARATCPAG